MPLAPCPLPRHDPGAEHLLAIVLNLLKFTQWVLWKCSACHELNGKAKYDTCTHRQRHLWTQTFLLDWGAVADGSETNQLACKCRAACLLGDWKGSWGAAGICSRWGLKSPWGAGIKPEFWYTPPWLCNLGQPLNPPSLGFPICQVRLRTYLSQMGLERFNEMMLMNWLYKPESTIQMKRHIGSRAQFEKWLKLFLRAEITLLWAQILFHHILTLRPWGGGR